MNERTPAVSGSAPTSRAADSTETLFWILRIAVFMCFIGHGSYGIISKPEWAPYFGVYGIPKDFALRLMPFIGLHDYIIATIALASPRPLLLVWAVFWCTMTATLRPLAGQGVWELLERGGNYGPPLAFLMLLPWPRSWREWTAPIKMGPVPPERLRVVGLVLRVSIALLLIGHAGFGAFQHKAGLLKMYGKAGLPVFIGQFPLADTIGWFELCLAAAVLLKPFRALLVFVCLYKIASELVYPVSGTLWWEFIERGGDYMAPIALILVNGLLAPGHARAPVPVRAPVPDLVGKSLRTSIARSGAA